MKVSIVLPVYNVEEYIEECLESILKQTYHNIEVILIDDGSNDNSGKICDFFAQKDNRIKVIHKKNEGVSEARNIGIKESTGDYITFVDPDDWIVNNAIEKMVNAIQNTNAEAAFCRFIIDIIPEEMRYLYQPISKKEGNGIDAVTYMFDSLAYGTMVWNKLFKRDAIFKTDVDYIKFDKSLKCGEDQVWLVSVIKSLVKVCFLPDELYFWRVREGSAFRNNEISDIKISDIQAQEMTLEMLDERNKYLFSLVFRRTYEKIYQYLVVAYLNNQKDYYSILKMYEKKYTFKWLINGKRPIKRKIKQLLIIMFMMLKVDKALIKKMTNIELY